MQKYNNRSEVPEEFKWDLTPFFNNEEEFNNTLVKCSKLIEELKDYVGCTKDSNRLYEFLQKQVIAIALWEDLYVYAYLINDQELGISENIVRKNKTEKLEMTLMQNSSFFAPELLKLSKDEYEKLFEENPKLNEFRADLDRTYREKEHILTENEEKIVAELTTAMNHYDDMSSNLLNSQHNYGKVKLDDGSVVTIATNNYRTLMKENNRDVRKKVYNLFNKKISEYSQTNALLLNSYVSMNEAIAKIRKYKSSWDSKLFGLNLSDKVFKTLVSTTESNYDKINRYYDIKRRALGLDILNRYDVSMELAKCAKSYSIPEAQSLVREAIKPLGNEYLAKYVKIINNRYVDYCQYKGKCSGAYSFSTIDQDSRILMSFNYNLDSVSTLAHESGHNVHHQFVNENNDLQYRNPSSIVAEVVSLTNECLLSSYLAKNGKTKEEQLAGISNILGVITSNLFDAVREGKLEQDIYKEVLKNGMVTKDFLDKKSKSSLKKMYGPAVKCDKYAANSWVTRSHYYMHFYLYSYSICISVATNVAKKILEGDTNMLENYYKFMKLGSDKWPMEAFEVLGVDLESSEVYQNAIDYFDDLLDQYEEISGLEVKDNG